MQFSCMFNVIFMRVFFSNLNSLKRLFLTEQLDFLCLSQKKHFHIPRLKTGGFNMSQMVKVIRPHVLLRLLLPLNMTLFWLKELCAIFILFNSRKNTFLLCAEQKLWSFSYMRISFFSFCFWHHVHKQQLAANNPAETPRASSCGCSLLFWLPQNGRSGLDVKLHRGVFLLCKHWLYHDKSSKIALDDGSSTWRRALILEIWKKILIKKKLWHLIEWI